MDWRQSRPLTGVRYLLETAAEGCRLDTPEGRARLLAQ